MSPPEVTPEVDTLPLDLSTQQVPSDKIWAGLITGEDYLPGLLTLDYALRKAGTKYPFIVLHTDALSGECIREIDMRRIARRTVPYLSPGIEKDWGDHAHYADVYTKLNIFSLLEYQRIILLDLDMLVVRNMDELFEVPLEGKPFAATQACACNPAKRPVHMASWPGIYTSVLTGGWDWNPQGCGWTTQHDHRERAQIEGPCTCDGRRGGAGGSEPNGGLLIVEPNLDLYQTLLNAMSDVEVVKKLNCPEQELLAYVFQDTWKSLPYIYNAFKTHRWEGIHDSIWDDGKIKNIHYILKRKPWHETPEQKLEADRDPLHELWWAVNAERLRAEKEPKFMLRD